MKTFGLFTVLFLVVLIQPGLAATFNVNSQTDAPDAAPGNGICATSGGQCTLRAAVMESTSSFGSFDTIYLPAGNYVLTIAGINENSGATGDLDIGHVHIQGVINGWSRPVIDANEIDRIFEVWDSASIFNVDIIHGLAPSGGGILIHDELTLLNVMIDNNEATTYGGGIRLQGASSHLVMERSTVYFNTSGTYGAGISVNYGLAEIRNSLISYNRAADSSGGLDVEGGTAYLEYVTVAKNVADSDRNGAGNGGGFFSVEGNIHVSDSIIAENRDEGGEGHDCAGPMNSLGYNFLQDTNGCIISGTATGNIYSRDPQLGWLIAVYGGTPTFQVFATSPARDSANPATCGSTDQRGVARPVGGACDIGAYEFNNPFLWSDDFEDGNATDWNPLSGSWSVLSGELRGKSSKKASNISPYGSCGDCVMEAQVRIESAGARASLLAYYQDSGNMMEVILMEDKNKVMVKHRVNGTVAMKTSYSLPIDVGVDYSIVVMPISSDDFAVLINGELVITEPLAASIYGGVGFRVRSTTGQTASAKFEEVFVY